MDVIQLKSVNRRFFRVSSLMSLLFHFFFVVRLFSVLFLHLVAACNTWHTFWILSTQHEKLSLVKFNCSVCYASILPHVQSTSVLKSDALFSAVAEQLKSSSDLTDTINATYLFVVTKNGAPAAEWRKELVISLACLIRCMPKHSTVKVCTHDGWPMRLLPNTGGNLICSIGCGMFWLTRMRLNAWRLPGLGPYKVAALSEWHIPNKLYKTTTDWDTLYRFTDITCVCEVVFNQRLVTAIMTHYLQRA